MNKSSFRSSTLQVLGVCSLLAASGATASGCGSDDGDAGSTSSGASGGGSNGFLTGDGGTSGSSGNSSSGSSGGGDGGPGSSSGGDTCAATAKRAETVPIDIGLLVDTSFSMDFVDKWVNLRAALKAFVNNPAYEELGLGVQFFPLRKQCSVADYALPAVGVGLLPTVAAQISTALDAQQMDLGTPVTQALRGMTDYLRVHARATPNRRSILLLATDGLPDDSCTGTGNENLPNTIGNAVAIAGDALSGSPSIPTFVIGVGTELVALDQIAGAGGTGKAILVDPTKNAQEAFSAALETIRNKAIPCDYDIPPLGNATLDTTKVNVSYSPTAGTSETFAFVGSADQCSRAAETGWYFDNPTTPTKIVLCPKVCERVKKDATGQVNVVFGCNRNDVK